MFDFFRRRKQKRIRIVVFQEKKGLRKWRWGGYSQKGNKALFLSPVRYDDDHLAYQATLEVFPCKVGETFLKWGPEFIIIKGREKPRLVTNRPMSFYGWKTVRR